MCEFLFKIYVLNDFLYSWTLKCHLMNIDVKTWHIYLNAQVFSSWTWLSFKFLLHTLKSVSICIWNFNVFPSIFLFLRWKTFYNMFNIRKMTIWSLNWMLLSDYYFVILLICKIFQNNLIINIFPFSSSSFSFFIHLMP